MSTNTNRYVYMSKEYIKETVMTMETPKPDQNQKQKRTYTFISRISNMGHGKMYINVPRHMWDYVDGMKNEKKVLKVTIEEVL